MTDKHLGSTIDDFMRTEGLLEDAQAQAIREVVAWQSAEAMEERETPKRRTRKGTA